MAKPSLKASHHGLEVAKQALNRAGWTQKELSAAVGCSRQPMTNFFQGKAIAQSIFMQICDRLGLCWQDIADLPLPSSIQSLSEPPSSIPIQSAANNTHDLNALVEHLRQNTYARLKERCGTIRVLDMSHPIEVDDLYISVNILEQITGRHHKHIEELLQYCDSENFDRFGLSQVEAERMPGLDAVQMYQKLIILGKPGAGKTTFLKHLAIQCSDGQFEPERLPIFVTLKDFAEAEGKPSLLEYISQQDVQYYAPPTIESLHEQWIADFYTIFDAGKALLLLDGLDEVRTEDHHRVIREIREFSQQFWANLFVITCRIAAWEYTFEKFTEVEVADFDESQVVAFARKWFKDKSMYAETFLKHLNQNPRIKQLTVSPLLLTLVCLAFEESGDCPSSRSELYKEGIDALLKKWDAKRGIQRDQVYRKLSPQRKEDLLSYIAAIAFRQKNYFLRKIEIERHITDYIRNLSKANPAIEELQLDSEVILQSIEAQHGLLVERAKGIFSFSHLSFHEYFTTREIVFNSISLDAAVTDLVQHVSDKRWREVFLLTTEMLRDASPLLFAMKQEIDQLLVPSMSLQQFLDYVCDRTNAPEFAFCKPAAVRAFFFDIDFDIDENRSVALHLDRSANILVCASFLTRMLEGVTLQDAIAISQNYDVDQTDISQQVRAAGSANSVMTIAIAIALDSKQLGRNARGTLKTLLKRLNGEKIDDEVVKQVADEARDVAKTRHHIGKEWHFNGEEKKLLKQYYNATQLLVECMNSDGCMMPPPLRQHLEETLFIPAQSISSETH